MAQLPVVIAGAGIAGLSAAIAFARQGLPVVLLEKRTGFEEAGAGIQLSPNASAVLIKLGVSSLAKTSVAPEAMDIRRWGEPRGFATMSMSHMHQRYGAPYWTTRRADLQTGLLDLARATPGITLLVDRNVMDCNTESGGLNVRIKRGSGQMEHINACFLVGADGLWSNLRAISGSPAKPEFSGYEAWRTLIPSQNAPAFMRQPRISLWMGRERHGVHYLVDAGRQINLVLVRKAMITPASLEEWSLPPVPAEVEKLSHNAAVPLKHLIWAAPLWRRWPLFDAPPVTMGSARIADGRLALIGDAAHAVLPFMAQGAALGIEDAHELAAMLGPVLLANTSDAARHTAIIHFNKMRHPRATQIYKTARRNGSSYHMAKPWSYARDAVIRHLGDEGMQARHSWIYGWKPSVSS